VVKNLGHAPSCASNGAEALDIYDTDGADVVVSDWMMPRMDGVQLCRCVRSRLGAPYTYFILLTALGDSEHRIAGMQAGADVVVSDWMMPRMDGVQLCRCLRARLSAPYTYFILLTALADPEHRIAGMHAGADDFLAKPFNLSDIEARLIAAERVTVLHRRRTWHRAVLQPAGAPVADF